MHAQVPLKVTSNLEYQLIMVMTIRLVMWITTITINLIEGFVKLITSRIMLLNLIWIFYLMLILSRN